MQLLLTGLVMFWLGGALATLGGLAIAARVRDISMLEPLALVKVIVLWPMIYVNGLSGQADLEIDAAMREFGEDAEFESDGNGCGPGCSHLKAEDMPEPCADKEALVESHVATINREVREHVALCPRCVEIEKFFDSAAKDG